MPRAWSAVVWSHHPVDCQVEKHRRHTTALPNTSLHAEADLTVSYPA